MAVLARFSSWGESGHEIGDGVRKGEYSALRGESSGKAPKRESRLLSYKGD